MKKSFYSILLVSLMLLFFSIPAFANTTASASATLNLDNFAAQVNLFTTGSFVWSPLTTTTSAIATANGLTDGPNGGTTYSFAQEKVVPLYIANGEAKQTSTLQLSSTSLAGPKAVYLPSAGSSFIGSATWTYVGADTTINFTIPYKQNVILVADPGATMASGSSLVQFDFTGTNGIYASLSRIVTNGQTSTNNVNLPPPSFSVDIYNGDTGSVYFEVSTKAAASAVPVPAALWLLGSGLLGLVGIRRKLQ